LDIGIVTVYQPASLHVDSNQLAGLLIPHWQFITHGGYLYLSPSRLGSIAESWRWWESVYAMTSIVWYVRFRQRRTSVQLWLLRRTL
jgi:hypothetical protein